MKDRRLPRSCACARYPLPEHGARWPDGHSRLICRTVKVYARTRCACGREGCAMCRPLIGAQGNQAARVK